MFVVAVVAFPPIELETKVDPGDAAPMKPTLAPTDPGLAPVVLRGFGVEESRGFESADEEAAALVAAAAAASAKANFFA